MKRILLSSMAIVALWAFNTIEKKSYKIDTNASELTWLAKKVTGQHNGTIKIKDGALDASNNKLTGGSFTIDMTTIVCTDLEDEKWNKKLVGHLKSGDFFGVEEHNTASFAITKAESKKSDGGNYQITGDLTIKNITNEVTFPAQVEFKDGKVTAIATIIFDRSKFDIRYGSNSFFDNLGDKTIYDDVEIGVNLTTAL